MNPEVVEVSLVVASGVYPILVCSVEATGLAGDIPLVAPMNVVFRLVVEDGAAEGDAVAIHRA